MSGKMNFTHAHDVEALTKLVAELTDYKRPVSYNLSEILVVKVADAPGWLVIWRKDSRK
jgi:hypothetical protein